jgi:hypothetical protein
MLALLLMMQEPVDNGNIIAAQNATIAADIKKSENAEDGSLPADIAENPTNRRVGADENVRNFDPTTPLYTEPNLCIFTNGQASAACGEAPVGGNQPIMVNNDIFGLSAGGGQATCQMIETIRRDSDGNAKKVYATYCGDELGASDYHTRNSPTGSEMPTKPTDRTFGPQSTTTIDVQ